VRQRDVRRLKMMMICHIFTPEMILSYRFRLFTTSAQEAALTEMLGAFADLYNAGLQQRIEAYQRRGVSLRYGNQAAELKAVRAADERLAGYSFSAEQQVLRRLDKAFSAFFGRIKRGAKPGFPRFRAKARFDSAELRVGDGLTIRKSRKIGIVGIPGEIKVRWHREFPAGAKLGAVVISRKTGKWFACFQIELPDAEPMKRPFAPIGIDLGLTSLVALSTGETVPTPQCTKNAAKALRKAQRAVARKKRHSRRQRKAKLRVARLHARVANQRRDFSHKLSRSLVNRFSHIAMENLNIKGLAAGMLAKSVHNAAWNQLVQMISYKAACAGGTVKLVDPRGTSQTCPECGTIKRKTLAIREHRCDCGCILDRDVAAARIVLMRANFPDGTSGQAPSQRIAA
jgi:putative transposase